MRIAGFGVIPVGSQVSAAGAPDGHLCDARCRPGRRGYEQGERPR